MREEEIWLPVKDYEGLYEVSNWGDVRSLNYNRTGRVQVMKPGMSRHGYLKVQLYKDGKDNKYFVHRLVAEAFLGNPDNLPQVNHKDEDKTNNAVANLEWCTAKENVNYGTGRARQAATVSRPVQQLTKNGTLVALWSSTMEAERVTGVNHRCIGKCCNGKRHTAGGFIWRYAE